MFIVPEGFANVMIELFGEEGLARLDRLPTILSACEHRWELTIAPPFASLSFHYVAPDTRADSNAVVVKACSPTNEFTQEAEALRLFDGHGMARLLAYNESDEVMLLERLEPGTLLRTLN